jgi:hypothetical protein
LSTIIEHETVVASANACQTMTPENRYSANRAVASPEALPDGALQTGDLLTDGCLRQPQGIRGSDEGSLVGHGDEGAQVAQVEIGEGHLRI